MYKGVRILAGAAKKAGHRVNGFVGLTIKFWIRTSEFVNNIANVQNDNVYFGIDFIYEHQ